MEDEGMLNDNDQKEQRRQRRQQPQNEDQKNSLNVPCYGWISSAKPGEIENTNVGLPNLNFPIIIWWTESVPPSFKHRKVYYSFLDEADAPMRTNVASGIRRAMEVAGKIGFQIHQTNTNAYVFPVPKMVIDNGVRYFKGKNLYDNYKKTSYIPPYVDYLKNFDRDFPGARAQIEDVKTNLEGIDNTQAGKTAQQKWYRNEVIQVCTGGDTSSNNMNMKSQCSTHARAYDMDNDNLDKKLKDYAYNLGWGLKVFLQYVHDNTEKNFAVAGVTKYFRKETEELFISLEQLIRGEWKFGFDSLTRRLIYPDDYQTPRNNWAGKPVPGLKNPKIYWDSISGVVPDDNATGNINNRNRNN
jgi:hypothetical protein